MKRKLLFGTHNQSKLERFRSIVRNLSIDMVGLKELEITNEVPEDGANVTENAIKKAKYYYNQTQIPTFSIDYGLYIDKFPNDKQPGLFVRRMNGEKATDQELMDYYIQQLKKVGGESNGKWVSAIAFVLDKDRIQHFELVEERKFVAEMSSVIQPGLPLSSLSIDLTLNKYVSEITKEERVNLQQTSDRKLHNIFLNIIKEL